MPTSSCSSIVDLGKEVELDSATSRLFFSDSHAAGLRMSWPAASEFTSTLTSQEHLLDLCAKHGVPSELSPVCAAQGWRACTPPPLGSSRMLCVYSAALEAGLRFPLHGFYARVLRRYQLAPSQLTPNAWTYLAAFVLRCEDAGVEPLVSVFRYFFTICAHRHDGKPSGWHHFQPYDGSRRLFTGTLSSSSGWRSKFFFLERPSEWNWNCQVKWGKPRREDVRRIELTDIGIEKLKQMGCVEIKGFLASREMPVGATPARLQAAVKAEARAGAGAAATAGTAAESASTTTRKRSRLMPSAALSLPLPTSVPPGAGTGGIPPPQQQNNGESTSAHPQSLAGSTPATLGLPRMRSPAVSIGGRSGVTPPAPAPHAMCAAKAREQADAIAKLNEELYVAKFWKNRFQTELAAAGDKHAELIAHLHAATDRNSQLEQVLNRLHNDRNEYMAEREQLMARLHMASAQVTRLSAEHAAGVARLKEEHAAENAQLKKELAAENAQLTEILEAEAAELRQEGYDMGANAMRDLALAMYKDVISPDDLKLELLDLNHHLHLDINHLCD